MPNTLHSKNVFLWNQVYSSKILYESQYHDDDDDDDDDRQEARVASYSTHSGGFHAPYDRLSNK